MSCNVYVEASPSVVWSLVTDVHLPARLSPELRRVTWMDDHAGMTIGARFIGYNSHPRIGEWRTAAQIVELQSQRAFGWVITDLDGRFAVPGSDPTTPAATWRFELEPEATGTRLRQSVRIGPGRSGLSMVIDQAPEREEEIVARRIDQLRTNIDATLRGIKSLAEQSRASD